MRSHQPDLIAPPEHEPSVIIVQSGFPPFQYTPIVWGTREQCEAKIAKWMFFEWEKPIVVAEATLVTTLQLLNG